MNPTPIHNAEEERQVRATLESACETWLGRHPGWSIRIERIEDREMAYALRVENAELGRHLNWWFGVALGLIAGEAAASASRQIDPFFKGLSIWVDSPSFPLDMFERPREGGRHG